MFRDPGNPVSSNTVGLSVESVRQSEICAAWRKRPSTHLDTSGIILFYSYEDKI